MKKLVFIAPILAIFSQISAHIFFPTLDKEIRTKGIKYHINLMWLNQKLNKEQEEIHPEGDTLTESALKWASLNNDSVVTIWFNGKTTSEQAIRNTKKKIKEKHSFLFMAPIKLRDIHELPEVQENEEIFSHPQYPVYGLADLARAIVCYDAIHRNPSKGYAIYADLDIPPLAQKDLCTVRIQKKLEKCGIIMAQSPKSKGGGYENGFQMLSNHKPNLLKAYKMAIIDANVKHGYNTINEPIKKWNELSDTSIYPHLGFHWLEQAVFDSYDKMFEYFYQLEGCGSCILDSSYNHEEYNRDKHGLDPVIRRHFRFTPHTKDAWCMSRKYNYATITIPTKDVQYPPLSHKYRNKP